MSIAAGRLATRRGRRPVLFAARFAALPAPALTLTTVSRLGRPVFRLP